MTQSFRILSIFILTLFALPSWAEGEEGSAVPQAIYYAISEPFTINFLNQSKKKSPLSSD